ncbi:DUF1127 domain-containing protein [Nitratireductor sp. ZSWI3]|uniref:DUF1127 domain-containing protein n=1 Tax=Nitratireductor sp. ZSWI3 TaxID=2966359 RepID=UPI0021501ECD|nr:DUF1127 domain-containing protein [Nitratireductor sp. ZSWI3]MCR4265541.1 DUF1127 domain-containing protein [Nitratireductor sp. ZSWI3]
MTPAHSDALAATAVVQPAGNVRRAAVAVLSGLMHLWKTRQAMRQLSEMSDWQLADIGLTRCDVDMVALRAPRNEATRRLQVIASERVRAMVPDRRSF